MNKVGMPPAFKSWSIGATTAPQEALPFLMELQEWCQSIGRDLTINEAEWGAKLFSVIKDLSDNLIQMENTPPRRYRIDEKYAIVRAYALRDSITKACRTAKCSDPEITPLNTRDLDAWFFTRARFGSPYSLWAYETSVITDCLSIYQPDQPYDERFLRTLGNPAIRVAIDVGLFEDMSKSTVLAPFFDKLTLDLSREPYGTRILSFWILKFQRNGSKWKRMVVEEKVAVLNELIDWIIEQSKNREVTMNPRRSYSSIGFGLGLYPTEVMDKAGVTSVGFTKQWEKFLPKPR